MNIYFIKKLLKVFFLILLFEAIPSANLKILSDEVNFEYSQPNFLLNKNSINLDMNNINSVLEILRKYDLKNSPKKVINNDGSITFFIEGQKKNLKRVSDKLKNLLKTLLV